MMAMDLTAEQKEQGKSNFQNVSQELSRRGFLKGLSAGAGVAAITPAVYFGYKSMEGNPVRAALIGCGDEGGILVGAHNPEYLKFTAICDIRPYNRDRIMEGDPKVPLRPGFKKLYGAESKDIKVFTDYKKVLEDKSIEAVVIATPLCNHARIAIDAMKAGKHVLCEKLMAWNVSQCKEMIKVSKETQKILSIGHQRHYSMLYSHAFEVLKSGVIGDVKHIRALWHRNNSWPFVADAAPKFPIAKEYPAPKYRDGWYPPIYQVDHDELKEQSKMFGFKSVEELVRWRLYNETGGGLMAELGSHQLDACSIFLGKVHPLSVSGVGGKIFYGTDRNDRDSDDSVFVTFEFPGPNHPKGMNQGSDKDDIVVVTYSSLNTNGFEQYGECVMGSRGTMIVEAEQSVMLYNEKDPSKKSTDPKSTSISVTTTPGNKPVLDASSTWGPGGGPSAVGGGAAAATGAGTPVSRGYKEEMEDFAYKIRVWDKSSNAEVDMPRCHGRVAMADAIIALTSNIAMKKKQRIDFKESWFDPTSAEVPDGDTVPRIPAV